MSASSLISDFHISRWLSGVVLANLSSPRLSPSHYPGPFISGSVLIATPQKSSMSYQPTRRNHDDDITLRSISPHGGIPLNPTHPAYSPIHPRRAVLYTPFPTTSDIQHSQWRFQVERACPFQDYQAEIQVCRACLIRSDRWLRWYVLLLFEIWVWLLVYVHLRRIYNAYFFHENNTNTIAQMQAGMESCAGKTVMAGIMGGGLGAVFGLFMASVSIHLLFTIYPPLYPSLSPPILKM